MKKILFAVLLAFALLSCSQQQEEAKYVCIKPLPSYVSLDSLKDATVPASFSEAGFRWVNPSLTFDVWIKDLYDAVEVSLMQVGDTLIYQRKPIVVESIDRDGDVLNINGGIENGGAYLKAYEGGTYRGLQFDDHSTYTLLGNVNLPLIYDFRIINCGDMPEDPYDTIVAGQKIYLDSLFNAKVDFNHLNTTILVEKGFITEITRKWIP
ncbi:MAG: hypothetical protein MJ009_05600 [Paludibacteraceae bacterium]|nr:hypothetical protein [Paludibacteraceae bacterium]